MNTFFPSFISRKKFQRKNLTDFYFINPSDAEIYIMQNTMTVGGMASGEKKIGGK